MLQKVSWSTDKFLLCAKLIFVIVSLNNNTRSNIKTPEDILKEGNKVT